mmetsp:Transcript_20537/g.38292  ORF Transcript_20537/g.38292 Transcript_20537/m.38292 type:complete len:213 (-) Transcript_20537:47-685(-)
MSAMHMSTHITFLLTFLLALALLYSTTAFTSTISTLTVVPRCQPNCQPNYHPSLRNSLSPLNSSPPPKKFSQSSQSTIVSSIDASTSLSRTSAYALRSSSLLKTTFLLSLSLSSLIYSLSTSPTIPLSYLLGSLLGVFYIRGLSSYVSTVGAQNVNEETLKEAGSGAGRFAGFLLLFVAARAFEEFNLGFGVAGFFTYQIASVLEGQREWND